MTDDKPKFKVGDKKFYIPGYRGHHLICILCTIVEVEDIPDGLYWLDEPIGRGVDEDDLLFQDEAVEELMARYAEETDDGDWKLSPNAQLADFRKESINYIASLWKSAGREGGPKFKFKEEKKPWNEWFNPQMVFDKRNNGAIKGAATRFEGKVYWVEPPGRHDRSNAKVLEENPEIKRLGGAEEQGFVLRDGTFVCRLAAAKIAVESGQIEKLSWPPDLYSEDLW